MKKIQKSNDAVVGIVAAFLVTGLIVMVISMLQTVYIPKWMEQAEAEHMENVADQFSQLKFAIDTQSTLQQYNTPMSTSIELGNKEMPFLISSRSYGSLEILSDECGVKIIGDTIGPYSIGSIKYSSMNSYYINQEYIYEAGALILSQSEGNTMAVKPAISIERESSLILTWSLNNIMPLGDKTSMSGYGSYPIKTEYIEPIESGDQYDPFNNVVSLEITTNYPKSWFTFFYNTLINSGVQYPDAFTIDFTDNGIRVLFSNQPTVLIRTVDIGAQIGPGWVENTQQPR